MTLRTHRGAEMVMVDGNAGPNKGIVLDLTDSDEDLMREDAKGCQSRRNET